MTLNLKLEKIKDHVLKGQDICYNGWTGNEAKHPNRWTQHGYDGVHYHGRPGRATHILGGDNCAIVIGHGAKHVRLESFTIHVGAARGIFANVGAGHQPTPLPLTLELVDCELVSDNPAHLGTWGVFLEQCNLYAQHCTFHLKRIVEHDIYGHGFGRVVEDFFPDGGDLLGTVIEDCTFDGAGAEAIKWTNRPHRVYYPSGHPRHAYGNEDEMHPTILQPGIRISRCQIEDYAQTWSGRGGGGIVLQGTAANILIEDTIVRGPATKLKHPGGKCLCIDDSDERHFQPGKAIGGGEPANGHVRVKNSLFYTEPCSPESPIIFLGPNATPGKRVVESLRFENCGVYGQGARVDIHQSDLITPALFKNCNTGHVEQIAQQMGIPTNSPARLPR